MFGNLQLSLEILSRQVKKLQKLDVYVLLNELIEFND